MTDLLPLGIHFGLPEDQHRADPGIGSTDLKRLLINPVGFWANSPAGRAVLIALGLLKDDDDSDKDTLSKAFGRAAHVVALEAHRFDAAYFEHEDPPEDYLTTKNTIRAALERTPGAYVPIGGAQRPELAMAARRAGLKLIEDWRADMAIKAEGRVVLSRRWMATLRLIERLIDVNRSDLDGKSVRQDSLSNGYPEVTIIWEEDGIRLKARVDYLRLRGMIDVKTYGCPPDKMPLAFFLGQVANYGYELQAVHYKAAWASIGAAIAEGRVFGTVDPDWLKRLRTADTPGWRWVAIQTLGFPEVDWLDWSAGMAEGAAEGQRRQALNTYATYSAKFGTDQPWIATRGRVVVDDLTLDATGIARRMMSRGEATWQEQ